ncbi:DUF4191 domain-containing protein [Nocardioides sp. CFH 31398]|uniref:DUF4191 domain-containing protein n=1 Tax=Nocardioides sp. CFH 31398 TaxID=2919579 RepID=UPI001F06A188|nr:DUF4191 domain-containing protein [Nocardioides sp. CFH 31398]MCH1867466.1 DUF4191 domain-containing protein [Nocardioides sp. CFH 31398]
MSSTTGQTRAEKRAAKKAAKAEGGGGRLSQIRDTYAMTKRADPKIGLILALSFVVGALVGFGIFFFIPGPSLLFAIPGAILFGLLATVIVFGRRAQASAYSQMEGQKGAAAAALTMLKRGWKTDPAVGFNKQQDVVHRVIGPPGIVLVGEGDSQARLRTLMVSERKKHERVLGDVPVHEVICGRNDGEVPLPKLVKHIRRMDKQVKPAELTDVRARIKAVDARRGTVPLPKGPVPTNMKGMRQNMRGR